MLEINQSCEHGSLKTCFKCGEEKSISEFYSHNQMKDGRLGKCKTCTKRDVSARYSTPEGRVKSVAYEQKRIKNPERKRKAGEYRNKLRLRNPIKAKAWNAVSNAIRDKRLVRLPCQVCGDPKSQAHHPDYSKPLAVEWLCFKHHRQVAHGQIVGV